MSAHPLHRWWDRHRAAPPLDAEWFPAQRAFYNDPSQLVAAIKGRRAGGTRGGCAHFVKMALATPGGQFLYLNSTRGEAERLAWYGAKNDGMASLCDRYRLKVKKDQSKLTLRFQNDAYIQLRGADDEAELRKALGTPYHEVWWDEAQKIPPKLGPTIREVMMPSLLDFGGRLRFVGTAVRQMSGMFWDVTRPEIERRIPGWSVHHWTLLDNPFFGATREERYERGMVGLQKLLGGPDMFPMDSPTMQREGFGLWVREDASFVYAVHKVRAEDILYAPQRLRPDGFPDIRAALKDLPFDHRQAFFGLGVDIGFTIDPFAFFLGCWHPHDPALYEVASWGKLGLDADDQAKVIADIREIVGIGYVSADVGGPVTPMGKGWSKQFMERYQLPVLEAEKNAKYENITLLNTDIGRGRLKLRDGGLAYENMSQLQWSKLVSGNGRMVEDPTMANDGSDSCLYMARQARHYGWSPAEVVLATGSREKYNREAQELEEDLLS